MKRRTPVLLQSESSECGLACVAMVAGAHGLDIDMAAMRRRWSLSLKGTTLAHLVAIAEQLKLASRALRGEVADLGSLRLPAILHWNLDHFVVVERVGRRTIDVIDPALGRRRLSIDEVSRAFTGIALELTPAPGFERRRDTAALPLRSFIAGARGLGGAIARLAALSIALQAFVLAAPLFGQIVIDEVVVTGDRDLLTIAGVAFLLLAGMQVTIAALRGRLVIAVGAMLQLGWGSRLLHHLLRLPLAWFEKRHVGDVVSRFGSLRAVERLVASASVEALVDGAMALTTLALMVAYEPALASVVVVAVLAYGLARAALYPAQRRVAQQALMMGAREQSHFMESVRAILPLKAFAREGLREASWLNAKSAAVDAEVRAARLDLAQQLSHTGIIAVENVAVLWLGALAVLAGDLSIGMLVAFVAYKGQFATRAAALVDHLVSFRLVRVHLDRVADIALASQDPACAAPATAGRLQGELVATGVHFRYADTEPFVLADISLDIRAGSCVALAAPSGFGKTTLLKLLMGLLEPTAGSITVDGVDLRRGALGAYRRQCAAVMQDDTLLAGTIADNITMFDPTVDEARIRSCARLAAVDDDITRMPMGYLTLVGDMGSTLSGGQRQRLLLARALYARPRILFLDEATSHLDPPTEARVHAALAKMRITRVIVAHRRETLAVADRVVQLGA